MCAHLGLLSACPTQQCSQRLGSQKLTTHDFFVLHCAMKSAATWIAFYGALVLLTSGKVNNGVDAFALLTPLTSAASRFGSANAATARTASRSSTRLNGLRMEAGGIFGLSVVTKALADAKESIVAGTQSQLQDLDLTKLELSHQQLRMFQIPDALPKLRLPTIDSGLPITLPHLNLGADQGDLGAYLSQVLKSLESSQVQSPEKFAQVSGEASQAVSEASAQAVALFSLALDALVAANPSLRVPVEYLTASLNQALIVGEKAYAVGVTLVPEEYQALVVTLAVGTVGTTLGMSLAAARESRGVRKQGKDAPLPREYDLPAIMDYYNRRAFTLFSRLLEISLRLGSLAGKVWLDRKTGNNSKNMAARAEELVEFLQGAGPAFIKIGQGVSIRPDILPEPYLRELVKLQDRVRSVL